MPVYTPPSQIVSGLYTLGKEWMIGDTLKEYIGPYHTYPNGAAYTLGTFVKGASEWLIPYSANTEITNRIDDPTVSDSKNNSRYFGLTGTRFDNYISPEYYFPTITKRDRNKGNFVRYFAQQKNDKSNILEISREQFKKINNTNTEGIDRGLWDVFSLKWTISGTLTDAKLTNQKVLIKKNYTYPGITNYLSDLNEFHPDEHLSPKTFVDKSARSYPDGEMIPHELPVTYGLPKVEIAEHNKKCGSCLFNNLGQCTLWNANIRNAYWCVSYRPKSGYKAKPPDSIKRTIQNDLYTNGGRYLLNGKEYIGPYHIHPDKGPMVGAQHINQPHDYLTLIDSDRESSY